MSWKVVEVAQAGDSLFVTHRCRVCGRKHVTKGADTRPAAPCVCSPAPQPKKRNTKGLRR